MEKCKRVGIFIIKPDNIFSNGCYQQSYFIHKMINMIDGMKCDFITIEANYTKYADFLDTDVILFDETTAKNYDYALMLSLTINDPHTKQLVASNNIKLIDLLCGNLFILLQEEFVFDCHNIMKNYNNSAIDEVWVLEMYEYSVEYLELLYNKPVRVLPYVWDVDIVKQYMSLNKINIDVKNSDKKTDKINICIYEPNMSIHKNAFIPLLIAERYYRQFPDRLHKIYIFCKEKFKTNGYYEHMTIFKDGKVDNHGRVIMPHTLKLIQDNNGYKNVVLSYTHLNNLNFLHLELLYIGVPIVHNCEPFQNGLFYDKDNLLGALALLEKARESEVDRKKSIDIICKYNTRNQTIQNKWITEFTRLGTRQMK